MDGSCKLIILRGNSGSGKTSTAKQLQKKFGHGTLLISQDVVRREMMYVKDGENNKSIELLYNLVLYGKQNSSIVILEGILYKKWYTDFFIKLNNTFKNNIHAYYFDIPFEETLKRHIQKINSNDFGEKEMKSWWAENDYIDFLKETSLKDHQNLHEVVKQIYNDIINPHS